MLLLYLLSAFGKYKESPIEDLGFKANADASLINIKRALVKDNNIILRAGADGGSIIQFHKPNPSDNWSFEFTINDIDLAFPENAGVYLWYTDHEIEEGNYNGAHGKFVGMMAGIEFLGRSVELVLGANTGEYDFEEVGDVTVLRDSPNPERFRDIKEFRVKIISTENNFKMEIYNQDKLVYDNLRFIDATNLGDRSKGKFFSITTQYTKVPQEKKFIIKNIQVYEREETEDYDPHEIVSPTPSDEPRMANDIYHPNKEIRHLIANLEHYMKYIRLLLGKPAGSTIIQGTLDIKDNMIKQTNEIHEILSAIQFIKSNVQRDSIKEFSSRISEMDKRVQILHKSIMDLSQSLLEYNHTHTKQSNLISWMILGLGIISLLMALLKEFKKKKSPNKEY
ncbi:hypothetical protein TCON_1860 [Astathelohania contejeani]|uniref:Uncharacterized protein n=1 Tax=Astathelohania contejeani TaxID=164912 RepID=A0ABQ7HXN3_9MICR|nr:hypothetical protein TCON_1860 [Thelohania contejeani]